MEDGDPTHGPLGFGHGVGDLAPIGHVDLKAMSTKFAGHPGGAVSVLVEDGHGCTLFDHSASRGFAHAGGTSGHNRTMSL
jgi:hypothetical protein